MQIGEQLPGAVVILSGISAGAFMGGIWGAIPGYLKAQLNVNEILSTISRYRERRTNADARPGMPRVMQRAAAWRAHRRIERV